MDRLAGSEAVRLDGPMRESIAYSLRNMTGSQVEVDEAVREARSRAVGRLPS